MQDSVDDECLGLWLLDLSLYYKEGHFFFSACLRIKSWAEKEVENKCCKHCCVNKKHRG